jgi:hypothetical protein
MKVTMARSCRHGRMGSAVSAPLTTALYIMKLYIKIVCVNYKFCISEFLLYKIVNLFSFL